MNDLATALARFNRKERNLLFQDALGQQLQLTPQFRAKASEKLGIEIAPDAQWWTDYHINWLIAALTIFTEPDWRSKGARPNRNDDGLTTQLIKRNQEDIDLVIASGLDLIFVEAKAYGEWSKKQLESKLARLDLVHREYIAMADCVEAEHQVRMHFLLMSRDEPGEITPNWPTWIRKKESKVPWIHFGFPSGDPILNITCFDKGPPDTHLIDSWLIHEH